jgi:hypothetical protein
MTLIRRFLAVLALDPGVFEEVEADRRATWQAAVVVLAAGVAAGIGQAGLGADARPVLLAVAAVSVLAWVAWALLLTLLGTAVLKERTTSTDIGEVLRTLGFAAAPGVFRAFEIFGGTRWLVLPLTSVWMVAAMVIAVRQAFDYTTTGRAVLLSLLGWMVSAGAAAVVGLLFARPVS